MQKFQALLNKFNSLPETTVLPPTFMEISGYPHYENVCSNILAFFFDTEEQHEYEDLFISSFLNSVSINTDGRDLTTLNIQREMLTPKGKFIDLVIETEDYVIGIENKIRANLYNDLKEYSACLFKNFPNKKVIKIVLSLHEISPINLDAGFKNITYRHFLNAVQQNLGNQLTFKNNRYLFQLLDFIESIRNHTKTQKMDKKVLEFFVKEQENIKDFMDQYNEVQIFIYNKLKRVRNALNQIIDERKIKLEKHNQWVWKKYDLVHDFTLNEDLVIAVDSYFEVDGIGINVSVRRGNKSLETLHTLEISNLNPSEIDEYFRVQEKDEMNLDTPDFEVAEKIVQVLEKIQFKKAGFPIVNHN